MKPKLKYILFATFLLLTILFFSFQELIIYGVRQGKGQLAVLWDAEPIEEVLGDPSFPDSLKSKLLQIEEIKSYAVNEFGMKGTDNYSTVYDQKGKDILWNVTACKPYEFMPFKWWFPIVGSVSYKGFFDLDLAKEEAKQLKQQGYDVRIRSVGAWSTLGWFRDPILSNLLDRSEAQLAETIFHELTHTTIFLEDSVEFNENLASFVAHHATLNYLTSKYGEESGYYTDYVNDLLDQHKYRTHFLTGKNQLDSLYRGFDDEEDTAYMESQKQELISEIIEKYDTVEFKNERYTNLWQNRALPNNAYFMYFARYYETPMVLDSLFGICDYDINQFFKKLKEMNN